MTEVQKCPWCVSGLQFVLALHGANAGTAFGQACFCSTGERRRAEIKVSLEELARGEGITIPVDKLAEYFGVPQESLEYDAEWHRRSRIAELRNQLDAIEERS